MTPKPATLRTLKFDTDEMDILRVAVRDHLAFAREERTENPLVWAQYVADVAELLERLHNR